MELWEWGIREIYRVCCGADVIADCVTDVWRLFEDISGYRGVLEGWNMAYVPELLSL